MTIRLLLLACAAPLLMPAALTVYTDYATWAAAVGQPIHAITFNSPLPPGPYSSGIVIEGVTFEGLSAGGWNGYLYPFSGGYCTGCLVGPPTEAGALGATDGYLRATFPGPLTAVAVDAGAYHSPMDIPVFTFSNGDTWTGPAQLAGASFYGFISSTPFTTLDYHLSPGVTGGDFTVLDTVYTPTPEPASLALAAAGLFLAAVRRRIRATIRV